MSNEIEDSPILKELRYIKFLSLSAHNIYMKLVNDENSTLRFTKEQLEGFRDGANKILGVSEGVSIGLNILNTTETIEHYTNTFQNMVASMVDSTTKYMSDVPHEMEMDAIILQVRTNFELDELNNQKSSDDED